MTATDLRDRLGLDQPRLPDPDHEQPMAVSCRTGAHSGAAVRFIQHQRHSLVWSLKGGVMARHEEGDPSLER